MRVGQVQVINVFFYLEGVPKAPKYQINTNIVLNI